MNVQPSRLEETPVAPVMSERKVSLLGAMLVAVGPVSMALFTPAMPEIVHAFGTTEAAVKMTLSLYFAGFALAQLVCGPLSDGFGRKPITVAFMAIYIVASALALFAPTIELLIAARFLQGVGAAVGVAISRAIVRDLFTNDRSARIMNLIGLILGIAVAVLPAGVLPASLATGFDFVLPGGDALWLILLLGAVTAGAQYFLSLAYKVADATYLQPFDDLKLPINTLLGWIVLSQVPAIWFWPGALLILAASSFILWSESQRRQKLTYA